MSLSTGNGGREGWCVGNAARTVKPELYAMVCAAHPGQLAWKRITGLTQGRKRDRFGRSVPLQAAVPSSVDANIPNGT